MPGDQSEHFAWTVSDHQGLRRYGIEFGVPVLRCGAYDHGRHRHQENTADNQTLPVDLLLQFFDPS